MVMNPSPQTALFFSYVFGIISNQKAPFKYFSAGYEKRRRFLLDRGNLFQVTLIRETQISCLSSRKSIGKNEYYRFSNRHTPKGVQCAFKDSMIHGKQFTLRIAFRCVLHRCESQEIRCQKLFLFYRYFRQKIHWFIMLGLGSTKVQPRPKIQLSAQWYIAS